LISSIFGTHFSLFSLFSGSAIRYTRAEDGTLYYCPSENRFKAGRPSATDVKNSFWEHFGVLGCTLFARILHFMVTTCSISLAPLLVWGSFSGSKTVGPYSNRRLGFTRRFGSILAHQLTHFWTPFYTPKNSIIGTPGGS
jgi:hypothetical protein